MVVVAVAVAGASFAVGAFLIGARWAISAELLEPLREVVVAVGGLACGGPGA